jgi:hypothetical protein
MYKWHNAGGNRAAAKRLWFQNPCFRRLRFTALFVCSITLVSNLQLSFRIGNVLESNDSRPIDGGLPISLHEAVSHSVGAARQPNRHVAPLTTSVVQNNPARAKRVYVMYGIHYAIPFRLRDDLDHWTDVVVTIHFNRLAGSRHPVSKFEPSHLYHRTRTQFVGCTDRAARNVLKVAANDTNVV